MRVTVLLLSFACGGDDGPSDPCQGIDCGAGECVDQGSAARCACDDGYVAQGLVCVPEGGDSDSDTDSDADCPDQDVDGHGAAPCGDDCDDGDLTLHPGADDNAATWTKSSLDDANGPTAITSHGEDIFIAYQAGDADALLAWWEGGWTLGELWTFDDSGDWLDIAIEPSGDTHAVIYDETHRTFIYRSGGGGGSVERDLTDVGRHCVVAVDDAGVAHFAYEDGNVLGLRVAWGVLGAFTTQEVVDDAPQSGTSTSIAVGEDGTTHVAYYGDGEILHAASPGWTVTPVELGRDYGTSIAVDMDGRPHVTYSGFGSDLRHAVLDGGTWGSEPIDGAGNTGLDSDAAFDAAGALHVVYFSSDTTLLHATDSSGLWRIEEIDSNASDPSISVGPDELRVSYRRAGSELWYASHPLPDGVDQNCDGVDGIDADGDAHASADTGGPDCDDDDPNVHPGAADPAGGEDADCDGSP